MEVGLLVRGVRSVTVACLVEVKARGKEARFKLVGLVVNKKGEPLFNEN
mgnify:CR=1 FL=1